MGRGTVHDQGAAGEASFFCAGACGGRESEAGRSRAWRCVGARKAATKDQGYADAERVSSWTDGQVGGSSRTVQRAKLEKRKSKYGIRNTKIEKRSSPWMPRFLDVRAIHQSAGIIAGL